MRGGGYTADVHANIPLLSIVPVRQRQTIEASKVQQTTGGARLTKGYSALSSGLQSGRVTAAEDSSTNLSPTDPRRGKEVRV